MLTIIIFGIIGIIIAIREVDNSYYRDLDIYIVSSILGGLLGSALGLIVAVILPMNLYDKHTTLNIESLQDNNSVNGNFFLGSGSVNGKMKYVFYYEENGYFKMEQVDYDKALIKYSAKPKVTMITKTPTNSFINLFANDLDVFTKTYIIEVPEGTIKNNYSLNAQ